MNPKPSTVEDTRLSEAEHALMADGLQKASEPPRLVVTDEQVLNWMHEDEDTPGVMITWDEICSGLRHRRGG